MKKKSKSTIQCPSEGKLNDNSFNGQNVLIYTSFLSSEETDRSGQINTQKIICEEYAKKHKINVIGCIDETNRQMFDESVTSISESVNNSKVKITTILVSNFNIISRSPGGILIAGYELWKRGMQIVSATDSIEQHNMYASNFAAMKESDRQSSKFKIIYGENKKN
jgi:hypothetical protein